MLVKRVTGGYLLTLEYGNDLCLVEACPNYPYTPIVPVGEWVAVREDGTITPDYGGRRTAEELDALWWASREGEAIMSLAPHSQLRLTDDGVCSFLMPV